LLDKEREKGAEMHAALKKMEKERNEAVSAAQASFKHGYDAARKAAEATRNAEVSAGVDEGPDASSLPPEWQVCKRHRES